MSTELLATFGILSAVVNTIGMVPYVKDVFKHKTKPERATWWIWLALGTVAISAQIAAGSTWSLFMVGAQTAAVATIAFLSLKYGYGNFRRKDFISLLVAMFGILLWKVTSNPLYALLIVVFIDAIAVWLTAAKTWEAPHTETLIAWILSSLAGLLGLLAVGKLDFTQILYPMYILIANSTVTWIIIYRRKKLAK
jgi:hypothetical protein